MRRQRASNCLDLLLLLLLVLGLLELQALLGAADELVPVVLLDGVDHEEPLEAPLLEALDEGGVLHSLLGFAGDVVDVLLPLLHAGDVGPERGRLVAGLGGVVAQELGDLAAVVAVLVDAQLEILPEGLVELVEVVLVLGDLGEHLQALLDDVLLDDLKDLVLLQHLTGDVERKVLGVDDTLDETEPLGDDVLAVVHDEDAAHVQLDVVRLLLAVEHVKGRALGHEEHALELELALDGEVLHREVVLPVVGEGLVEGGVLVAGDLVGGAHPDGLLLV